jgi:putative transposase
MSYRTIAISWLPRSQAEWRVFTAVRQEAANVWSWLVEEHATARLAGGRWPSKAEWQKQAKGRFLNLLAQSVQQTIADFCEAVTATTQLRRNGHPDASYPFRKPRYRVVIFTNQGARIKGGHLLLPCGQAGKLRVRLPEAVKLPGRLMEVRLHYGTVELVCAVADTPVASGPVIGIDLGVNTLLAATDGDQAILVSGREVKAQMRLRNKQLAEVVRLQSKKAKGSRRWQKLQRRKWRNLEKAHRRILDLCHKATRQVANAFPHAKAYVGQPFNDAARRLHRVQAQLVHEACNAKLIAQLGYKLAVAVQVPEAYSSQECPCCGVRNKCRRTYRCACGTRAPRDVVGCTNILAIGQHGGMSSGRTIPRVVVSCYPGSILALPGSRADTSQVARVHPTREAPQL